MACATLRADDTKGLFCASVVEGRCAHFWYCKVVSKTSFLPVNQEGFQKIPIEENTIDQSSSIPSSDLRP